MQIMKEDIFKHQMVGDSYGCFCIWNKPDILGEMVTCFDRRSKCFLNSIPCPKECLETSPGNSASKACYLDCASPICKAQCRNRKPNCNAPGAACLDPRFIGGDGVVFYFHGKSNEHFTLVFDHNLQINARFIGLRPPGRTRDYTWIQALGILFKSHMFSVEAIKSTKWDGEIDHLKFTYKGEDLFMPQGYQTLWESQEVAEISVNVVPVTEEDDRIHNYRIPEDDCFAHLEVQFRFYDLSSQVEGLLGRTYQPEFENPAKQGVAMAVVKISMEQHLYSLLNVILVFSLKLKLPMEK
ncbi:hypothetical protein L6452_00339 [Arctium lappa]|uniref:Uncharacterized protein n=1 Tax=Arctium lappa TaxID=4217 RepID=A0ACB9FD62_ARCLA|nr:hypothetical protein L6452_00339 [Arctium lappa]